MENENIAKIFQLCNSVTEAELKVRGYDNDIQNYQANIKYDGERIMAVVKNGETLLINRRNAICNQQFKEVVEELNKLPNCILDGEIISIDDKFEKLQQRALTRNPFKIKKLTAEIPVKYMVFDILALNDLSITGKWLNERLIALTDLFKDTQFKFIELAEYKPVMEMLEIARTQKREGIIIKKIFRTYESRRCDNWIKLKFFNEENLMVKRYTENPKGIRVEDDLLNAVQVAGTQSEEVKKEIDTKGYAEITIQYLTKTKEGRFRFPSFRGLVK